ncbi:MAG: ABC transporter permease [Candidatus Andersenbacteria bacterium]|nr:ABC transporter permease [Candidatus Andersenbacteria bacterium]MBI3250892.1 ABC transporter permease [Candidatus Andersenbacteria bacterium]
MQQHSTLRLAARIAWTDFSLRFKRTKLGIIWGVLNPFFMFMVLFVVLTRFRAAHSEHLFIPSLLIGLLTWELFSDATTLAAANILQKRGIVRAIPFPLISLPLASVFQTTAVFLTSFVILLAVLPFVSVSFHWIQFLFIIPFASLLLLTFAVACFVSIATAFYPDTVHIWRWFLRVGFFISPVFYTTQLLLPENRPWFMLNPIARILETARATLLFHQAVWPDLTLIFVITLAAATLGFIAFQKYSSAIRDRL